MGSIFTNLNLKLLGHPKPRFAGNDGDKAAVQWLKNLEGMIDIKAKEGRDLGGNGEEQKRHDITPEVLAVVSALILHGEPEVALQAISTATRIPQLTPIMGVHILPVLVYALQRSLTGNCVPQQLHTNLY